MDSGLTYDAGTHRSWLADGREVPHVTAVLSAVGVATDFDDLGSRSARMAETLETARARGTAVHADCHAYDDDDLDWATVDPRVLPYVEAWAQCRETKRLVPLAHARERRVYHPLFNYTGILDGIFGVDGLSWQKRILIDIKTGDPDDAAAHLQTAAYAAAWECEHPDQPIDERWAIWLRPDRVSVPFSIINYTNRPEAYRDFALFQACLAVYAEQRRRRIV